MALAFPSVSVGKLLPWRRAKSVPEIDTRSQAKNQLPANWYRLGISRYANWGNVYSKRIALLSDRMMYPALAVGLFAGYHLVIGVAAPFFPEIEQLPHLPVSMNLDPTPPAWIAGTLATDRKTYFDLGGGLQGDEALAWMADYRPKPESLSAAELDSLTAALKADLPRYGTNAAKWKNVAVLPTAPKITRAAKAIAEYGDRLKTGVIVIFEDSQVVPVVSHVEGAWSVVLFRGSSCRTFLGPVPAGCEDHRAATGIAPEAHSFLSMIDPRKV